jgi:hypothetical protein
MSSSAAVPSPPTSVSPSVVPLVTPEAMLDSAELLLTSPLEGLGNLWPRACALVIRLALEQSLDRYWARVLPEAAECGMRQQLLLLPLYASSSESSASSESSESFASGGFDAPEGDFDPALDAASLAREAWRGLARAAHHHVYELAPTAQELRRWHTAVSRLTVLLAQAPDPR